jgi:hypothetical protein
MRHNLTAVFNNQDDARHVLDELLSQAIHAPGPHSSAHPSPAARRVDRTRACVARSGRRWRGCSEPRSMNLSGPTNLRSCRDATSLP